MVAQNIAFGIVAAIMVWGALRVVTVNNVVHAALWLVLVLAGAAAQYVILAAEFVAITQVLVYIGAEQELNNKSWWLGVPSAGILLGVITLALVSGFGDEELPQDAAVVTTQEISDQIFGPYLLPFWALSFVLLVAVIGAIVLARKD
jgi:NADH-quinone oxidoreductase subunit J